MTVNTTVIVTSTLRQGTRYFSEFLFILQIRGHFDSCLSKEWKRTPVACTINM
jgi:hypothetical protein